MTPPKTKTQPHSYPYPKHPFLMTVAETADTLQTNIETGLTDVRVRELRQVFGPNKLVGDGGVRWYAILGKQVSNAMVLVGTYLHIYRCIYCIS